MVLVRGVGVSVAFIQTPDTSLSSCWYELGVCIMTLAAGGCAATDDGVRFDGLQLPHWGVSPTTKVFLTLFQRKLETEHSKVPSQNKIHDDNHFPH